ncbi:hypothetical protein, partial [Hoeflea sp. BAL378]|uniref:hypothetical protein n=1 Tax=Hoeflea sp. BAL378 TaxID=1547437 RepID=UPI000552A436
ERAPTVAEIREVLLLLGELGAALNDRMGLADRIAKMEQDQARYSAMLNEVASLAGIEITDATAASIARDLSARAAAADQANSRQADLSARLEEARQRQRDHAEKLAAHTRVKDQMLSALEADTLTQAAIRVDRALERKALSSRIEEIERQIRTSLGTASFEEARALLAAADATALGAERQELES